MSLPRDVALAHQFRRQATANSAVVAALKLWRLMNPQELDAGWAAIAPQLVSTVSAAQITAAAQATPYMAAVDRYYGAGSDAVLVPEAFGGIVLSGAEVGPEMFGAVAATKTLTSSVGAARAFEMGAASLASIVAAAIQDMGRQADNTLAVGKKYTRYVRAVNPGACSRCAILAGKASYAVAFKRHPRCKCTTWPIPVGSNPKTPESIFDSPENYFESLSKAEQDRVFTKAGAEAIRNGANPVAVVNARRGALSTVAPNVKARLYTTTIGVRADGSPLQVFATREGLTARSVFGRRGLQLTAQATKEGRYRRTTTVRLMPETIAVMAGGNQTRWVELLKKYGYLY